MLSSLQTWGVVFILRPCFAMGCFTALAYTCLLCLTDCKRARWAKAYKHEFVRFTAQAGLVPTDHARAVKSKKLSSSNKCNIRRYHVLSRFCQLAAVAISCPAVKICLLPRSSLVFLSKVDSNFPLPSFYENRPTTRSHYTERKKCGPRSGQKTTNKMRRLYTAETQLRRRYTAETQLQHDRANRAHHHRTASLGRRLSPDGVDDLHHSSAPLGRSPPLHSAPTLSAGELSGETTCVDHTDYSDNGLPPQQGLLRDESGSSWWSLDDQGAVPAGAAPARVEGAACEGGSWRPHEHQAHHQHQRGESVKAYDRSGGVGGNYGYNSSSGLEQRGLWSGVHSSSTAGTVSGSGGSAGESWEDDDSEEGLGRAEEEVAALLVGLGKTNEDFEGFSDDEDCCVGGDGENDGPGRDRMFSKPPTRHIAVSTSSQEWSV